MGGRGGSVEQAKLSTRLDLVERMNHPASFATGLPVDDSLAIISLKTLVALYSLRQNAKLGT
jgi:hypothetical protein